MHMLSRSVRCFLWDDDSYFPLKGIFVFEKVYFILML